MITHFLRVVFLTQGVIFTHVKTKKNVRFVLQTLKKRH